MTTPQGTVRFCRERDAPTFQVLGWGTMKQSLAFRRRAEEMLAGGAPSLRVDLRHCTYLDSTFLGTLLTLQRTARCRGCRFLLISPSTNCCRLFQQMGIEEVFATEAAAEPEPIAWTDLACEREDACLFNRNVVQAHQELADLGGKAGAVFGEVARKLAREWDSGTAS
jgi:anti-sigma B factor antagonist